MPTEEFINNWTKMKESISSGISGVYFGHLKACANSAILANFKATWDLFPIHQVIHLKNSKS
jgi:hypothetical protein